MRLIRIFAVGLAASGAFFAACGGESSETTEASPSGGGSSATGSAATAPADGSATAKAPAAATNASNPSTGAGSCEVKVTGDLSVTGKGQGGASAVGSDYWLTDDELREGLKLFEKFGNPDLSTAQVEKNVDEKMKNDPRLFILILNCQTSDGDEEISVSVLPSNESKYRDVPYGPKKYAIAAGGILGGDPKTGEFGVLLTIGGRSFAVSEAGELNITKWDGSGIAGAFTFAAKEPELLARGTAKAVSVAGAFSYKCTGQRKCRK